MSREVPEGPHERTVGLADAWRHLKRYGYAPGDYMAECCFCGEQVVGVDKRAVACRTCAQDRYDHDQK